MSVAPSPPDSSTDVDVPGPSARQWVDAPVSVPAGIPPGLEYLLGTSDLVAIPENMHQCGDCLRTGYCCNIGMSIVTKDGKRLYTFVKPKKDCCERCCPGCKLGECCKCKPCLECCKLDCCKGCGECCKCCVQKFSYWEPGFEMRDQSMRVVATFKYVKKDCGYYACNPCAMLCAPCKDRYSVELHCFDANGNNMGFVKHYNYKCCERPFCCDDGTMDIHIQNAQEVVELKASSTPAKCLAKCCDQLRCKVPYNKWTMKAGEANIGQVAQRDGCDDNACFKCCSKIPSWGITFPSDMDVTTKARQLGLLLMVQTVYSQSPITGK